MIIATQHDLQDYLGNPVTHDAALDHLQLLMDEEWRYDAAGTWSLVGGGGLARLGLTRAEAVAWGAKDRVVMEPAEMTLAEAQTIALLTIRRACDAALQPLASAYPDREVQSWPQQIAEATVLASDPAAAAPLLRQMAAVRPSLGDTQDERVAELARRILANATAWSVVAGPIIGHRQALEDQVMAATTPQAVTAIVIDFGGAV